MGTLLESFTYDALGRRITDTPTSTGVTDNLYYSSQWQVLQEDISNLGLQLHSIYVWSPVFVDALVLRDENLTGTLDETGFNYNDRVFAIQDANYNVTALVAFTNAQGDANGDGEITDTDASVVLSHFGSHTTLGAAAGDVNGDGTVDLTDLSIVSNNEGTTWEGRKKGGQT